MIKVGVALLPEVDPAQDRRWSRVEEYGFAHGWSLDHLAWRAFADSTWHATVPALAAAALTTSRLTLGTFVASPNFRHPVPFAKELMTLDVMSGGRLLIGVGAGGAGFDAAVLGGRPLSGRAARRPVRGVRHAARPAAAATVDHLVRRTGSRRSRRGSIPGPGSSRGHRSSSPATVRGACGWRCAAETVGPPTESPNHPARVRAARSGGAGWRRPPAGSTTPRDRTERRPGSAGCSTWPSGWAPPVRWSRCGTTSAARRTLGFTDVVIAWPRDEGPLRGSESVLAELGALLVDGSLAP